MSEWNEAIQSMIDWIEGHISENPSLMQISAQIGYSPYYCSVRFHEITGMTLKSYLAGRRLAMAALAIRDTDERILDIAVRCGYSSQEALTRAFLSAFGCTPASYRRDPVPIPLS
ncbi:MAG: helix-turn-helix transcriptional regulator, partial [Lachnospiraceae bacterium]|nr:helix-turn-helix transcriptional regulator [Lachnospiraceae bacterium]